MKTYTAFLAAFLLLTAPAFSAEAGEDVPAAPEADASYVVQPDDILEIFVWKEPELSRQVTVRPDGRISFPLVQDMPVAGQTPKAVKTQIEERLAEYIQNPNVTVIVAQVQNYRVFVLGRVRQPGYFISPRPLTVVQALSLAGGFEEFADKSDIAVVRSESGRSVVLDVDFKDVVKGNDLSQNFVLRSGDVVIVP